MATAGKATFQEGDAPATPSSGYIAVYGKTDGKVYSKDDAGTEYDLTAGAGVLPVVDTTSIVTGSADPTKEVRFEVDGNTAGIIGVLATAFTTAKTVTFPDATDTLVGKDTTDTLTNKTINDADNAIGFEVAASLGTAPSRVTFKVTAAPQAGLYVSMPLTGGGWDWAPLLIMP